MTRPLNDPPRMGEGLGPVGEQMVQRMAKLSDAEREDIRRIMSGEADRDLLPRGMIHEAIRELRLSKPSLASREYQQALADVQRAVSRLVPPPSSCVRDRR